MSKIKEAQAARIVELERKLMETEAQLAHVYHFAEANLPKFSTDCCTGSAVILTLSTLGGKTLGPVAIRNGLSQATIDALQADFVRSYEDAVVFKPKGVTS